MKSVFSVAFICAAIVFHHVPASGEKYVIDLALVIRLYGKDIGEVGEVKGRALAEAFLDKVWSHMNPNETRVAVVKEKRDDLEIEMICKLHDKDHDDPIGCVKSAKYELDVENTDEFRDDATLANDVKKLVFTAEHGDRPEAPNFMVLIALSPDPSEAFAKEYGSMQVQLIAEDYNNHTLQVLVNGKTGFTKTDWNKSIAQMLTYLDYYRQDCDKPTSSDSMCFYANDQCIFERSYTAETKNPQAMCTIGTGTRPCSRRQCDQLCEDAMVWSECNCKTKKEKLIANTTLEKKFYENCPEKKTGERKCACPTPTPKPLIDLETWEIVVIALGATAFVLTIVGIVVCVITAKKKRRRARGGRPAFLPPSPRRGGPPPSMMQGSMAPSMAPSALDRTGVSRTRGGSYTRR